MDGFKTERVTFYSGGYALSGVMFLPPDDVTNRSRAGIVLCQGFGGFKEGTPPTLAAYLARQGFVVLTFDYRGFGESEGPRGRLDPFGQVEDVRNGLTYLETRDDVDPDRLGLYGTSFGGALVSYAAAVDQRAKATVATVPVANGERWLRSLRRNWEFEDFLDEIAEDRRQRVLTGQSRLVEKYHVMVPDPRTLEYYEQEVRHNPNLAHAQLTLESPDLIMQFKPDEMASLIAPRAFMVIGAERDVLVRPTEAVSLYDNAREPKRLVVLPNVNHFTVYKEGVREEVMALATEWYETHMHPKGGAA